MHTLPRIGSVERLIQNENLRIVHQRRGKAHSLPHSARVGIHRSILRVGKIDESNGAIDCALQIAHAFQTTHHSNEVAALHEFVDSLVLRHHADATIQWGIATNRLTKHRDGAARRRSQSCHHAQQSRLARAIGSEQSGNSGHDLETDFTDSNDTSKPSGDTVDANHCFARSRHDASFL